MPVYEQERAAYDAQIAKLDATKGGVVARMAADIAKSDLKSTIGAKVFDKAKRLNDLQTTMKSHVTQDLEQQINQTTDKLAVNEFAKQHLQRTNGEHVEIKDYTGAAGVLFGSMTRHATTYLSGLAARHQDALHIAAAGGMMAAPLAAVLGAGTYSTLSIDAVEKSALAGLDLALDRLGVDKYSRGDISKGLYEVGKLGASGGVVKHGQMFSRQAANLGRRGLQAGRAHLSELRSAPKVMASFDPYAQPKVPNISGKLYASKHPHLDLYRKLTSQSLNELALPVDQKLIEAMKSKGWRIDIAKPGTDDWKWLTMNNADASFNTGVSKHMLIKEGAPKSALLEEFLHGTQNDLQLLNKYGSPQALEVHVKDFMLRHVKLLGLDNPNDINLLRQLKVEEINRLRNMQ